MLDIPMYARFSKVMFYDVLQQLTLQVVMLHYNRERIRANKLKLKFITMAQTGWCDPNDDTIQAMQL